MGFNVYLPAGTMIENIEFKLLEIGYLTNILQR